MTENSHHLHLVSDATGETINSVARACLAQFGGAKVEEHIWSLIRSRRQLDMVLEGLRRWPGLALYTFVDDQMRAAMEAFCREQNIPHLSVLDPVMNAMSGYFGIASGHDPGRQHALDAEYFSRIDAMDFAIAQDDGHKTDKLDEADIVLIGVSRTSKTPTCIYLANRGYRAANVPLIPGMPPPPALLALQGRDKPFLVGLTKDPDSLIEIRRNRLRFLQQDENTDYIDPETVRQELRDARRLFTQLGCMVIDVTRRSIEETAAEIIMALNRRAMTQNGEGQS
ncbi:pyruvate, water dikinase regulatory protein [Propionivibrio sp.]|uniref:pyruvate, water dikinase regulatory protein n=1 Tax=Propionivibrio sp. TaxID=2212460 RepID=UPI0026090043|nr:pyruvate, water dikinase regulatory protein [Propionivibrio sp.]